MDRTNYLSWKSQFEDILEMHNLTAVVKNNTDPLKVQEDGSMHPELAKDKLVLSWIKTTSSSSIKTLLIPCTTAHQAWTMLAKRLSPLASTRVRILRDQIRTLRKDNNTTVVDYLNYAKSLFDSLTQSGATMDDDYLNHVLHCYLLTLDCLVWMLIPYLIPHRSMVGGLQYLTLSWPDISFVVNQVCQFMHNPRSSHLQVVKRILWYIKGTVEQGPMFHQSDDFTLRSFSDADWAGSVDDRRSTTGSCIFFGPNLLTWTAKKQSTVSRSSTEAEYHALAHTIAEIRWFGFLFRELGIPLQSAPCIYVDNLSAIYMAANPIFHARTWHIEIDYHFVRELVARKALHTFYVLSSHQLADIFTKGLNRDRFSLLKSKLNLRVALLRLRGVKRILHQQSLLHQ
jgi:hypothetical protein